MSTFRSYGKVNEFDQAMLEAERKNTRKRIAIIFVSFLVLTAIIVGAVLGTTRNSKGDTTTTKNGGNSLSPPISTSIKAVCDVTLYKDSCYNSLSPMANSTELKPQDIFGLSMEVAVSEILKASRYFSDDNGASKGDNMTVSAMENFRELLSLAIDHLNDSLSTSSMATFIETSVDDLRTWLSSAGTYQQTCIDGFKEIDDESVDNRLKLSFELTSNSLAIITWISKVTSAFNPNRRRLMILEHQWPLHVERVLAESSDKLKKKADIIVAKDGSGQYKMITEAMKAVPEKSKKKRTVIYVKKVVYKENVRFEKNKWNVTMIGDGMNSTIVTWNLNVVDGTPTFSTATFGVVCLAMNVKPFSIQHLYSGKASLLETWRSSTPPDRNQSIFYRCRFDGFQDTLYTHSNRQFYSECDIIGTVDFIFGNSAVIFQNCNIRPRQPMANQQNTITAQGKVDPNQNTGISIHNCTVSSYGNLSSSLRTFLGRPWKDYSTTVFMQSNIGSLVHPAGWLPWTGNSAPNTIYYSEYKNIGVGSSTKNRVKWKGLRKISDKEAKRFTVKELINGDKWISDAGVTYKSNL